jgi:uncharacterized protein YndB with AHSA1/START domain
MDSSGPNPTLTLGGFEVFTVIKARPSKVWKALTDPGSMKQYMSGAEITTDWKIGSPIIWKGVLQGKKYENKGTVLNVIPEELLEYTYWSDISKHADIPENYARIRCRLTKDEGGTMLAVNVQDREIREEARKHLEWGWKTTISSLKRFLEEQ